MMKDEQDRIEKVAELVKDLSQEVRGPKVVYVAVDPKWVTWLKRIGIAFSAVCITAIIFLSYSRSMQVNNLSDAVAANQRANTQALCALRHDLETRVVGGYAFLKHHRRGILGLSYIAIKQGLDDQTRTIKALSLIRCPKS